MRKEVVFRRVFVIALSAILTLIPIQAVLAEEATETEEAVDTETAKEEPPVPADDKIQSDNKVLYYENEATGASCALVISGDETMVISFDADISGLAALLEQEGVDHIDSLIMASFSDVADEAAMKELHEKYPVGHLYASSGNAALQAAGTLGIRTDYAGYLSVGDENVILYPDETGNLGVLVFDENGSLFAADTITDMSVLQDHPEIAFISVLSISDRTGTDEEVISSMNPQACIITGSLPENRELSAFYDTDIARSQTFYINHSTLGGIEMDLSDLTEIRDAAALQVQIPDPELFAVLEVEPETEAGDATGTGEGDQASADASADGSDTREVSAKQAIAEAALRIWTGDIGRGQARTDTLRSEGFTEEEMKEIQRLVDKIASENLGSCTAVIFYAGDYAEDPDAQIVSIQKTATEPQLTSTDEHYQFTGWYTDKECTEKFDFSTPIEDKTILYAGWEAVEEPETETEAVEEESETATEPESETVTEPESETVTEPETEEIKETEPETKATTEPKTGSKIIPQMEKTTESDAKSK